MVSSAAQTAPARYLARPSRARASRPGSRSAGDQISTRSAMASPRQDDLEDGAGQNDGREDQRQCRAVTELKVGEGIEVDQKHRRRGHVPRLAGGHDVELVEGE